MKPQEIKKDSKENRPKEPGKKIPYTWIYLVVFLLLLIPSLFNLFSLQRKLPGNNSKMIC